MSSPPTTLGQYQIIREIARSNDIVYEAYDPLMNRRVAVKELSIPSGLSLQQREERLGRFRREAQAAGSLNHPNIMTVYSFAEDAGRHFMAMEYLDGCTLRNELDTKGFLSPERAVEIASAVLEGLSHAHSKGVVHRDIKPENIQLLSNGGIKITDFGIARLTFQPNLTVDGQVFGTPSYMSPEQVVGKEIDQKSDLWSVGVLLYEMMSGQKPFVGDSVVSISYGIMNRDAVQPAGMAYEVWAVVRKALEKAPQMRFASASEFSLALSDALRHSMAPVPNAMQFGVVAASPAQAPSFPFDPYSQTAAPGVVAPPPQVAPSQGFPLPQTVYGQAPVYYPPPPRPPLLKDDQVIFLKRLGVTILLVGTLFLIVLAGVDVLTKALMKREEQAAAQRLSDLVNRDDGSPILDQIRRNEELLRNLRTPSEREYVSQAIARQYERLGEGQTQKGDYLGAENAFKDAIQRDTKKADYYADLANLSISRLQGETRPLSRAQYSHSAAGNWLLASTLATSQREHDVYLRNAYEAAVWFAEAVDRGGLDMRPEVRTTLYDVHAQLPNGSQEQEHVRQWLEKFR